MSLAIKVASGLLKKIILLKPICAYIYVVFMMELSFKLSRLSRDLFSAFRSSLHNRTGLANCLRSCRLRVPFCKAWRQWQDLRGNWSESGSAKRERHAYRLVVPNFTFLLQHLYCTSVLFSDK